jgi:hypothetical protein
MATVNLMPGLMSLANSISAPAQLSPVQQGLFGTMRQSLARPAPADLSTRKGVEAAMMDAQRRGDMARYEQLRQVLTQLMAQEGANARNAATQAGARERVQMQIDDRREADQNARTRQRLDNARTMNAESDILLAEAIGDKRAQNADAQRRSNMVQFAGRHPLLRNKPGLLESIRLGELNLEEALQRAKEDEQARVTAAKATGATDRELLAETDKLVYDRYKDNIKRKNKAEEAAGFIRSNIASGRSLAGFDAAVRGHLAGLFDSDVKAEAAIRRFGQANDIAGRVIDKVSQWFSGDASLETQEEWEALATMVAGSEAMMLEDNVRRIAETTPGLSMNDEAMIYLRQGLGTLKENNSEEYPEYTHILILPSNRKLPVTLNR